MPGRVLDATALFLAAFIAWGFAGSAIAQQPSPSSVSPAAKQAAPDDSEPLETRIGRFESAQRDVVANQEAILAACQLKPGMTVVDLGAGSGLFSRGIAAKVGTEGKVFALDTDTNMMEHIAKTCQAQSLPQVKAMVCPPTATGLAARSADAVFVCDAYHHFAARAKSLASIHETLREGGHLVVIDPQQWRKTGHRVHLDRLTAIEEITAAGFKLVDDLPLMPDQYFLRFEKTMRPPATPLVVHDPYFSIWSGSDHLAGSWPKHWTGATHALTSFVRIDGKPYRIMGSAPEKTPAMRQVRREVLPTRTIYEFEAAGVRVQLTFTTPVLRGDLDRTARPLTYLQWKVWSVNDSEQPGRGKPRAHDVSIYYDNSAEMVVHEASQAVRWSRPQSEEFDMLRMGSQEQPVLAKVGDFQRIDWGYAYVVAEKSQKAVMAIGSDKAIRNAFAEKGELPTADDTAMPRPANRDWPVAACVFRLGSVGSQPKSRWLMLAYDDLYSIEYLGQKLRPYWRRNGAEAIDLFRIAAKEHAMLESRCEAFDADLMAKLRNLGGPGYADLCALAYREAMAGHKLAAGPKGEPMLFPKENSSNGCIATVDVIYPAAPFNYFMSNEMLKASLTPILEYSMTDRWKFPFAPHDLGTYPKANGQVYGGGEKTEKDQMPVEESGNMLILAALACQGDGNTDYVARYWKVIDRWAEFLRAKGLDPENQLCTDDFAGHLAHNANLSLKAIVAMALYSQMCEKAGRHDVAKQYRDLADQYAKRWTQLADDGDHFRLAFDRPGTWSQKYNLVWDRILIRPSLFGDDVLRKELDFYPKMMNRFGLPLDNRETYTKTDWHVWTASISGRRADFDAIMGPLYEFVSQTPQRIPLVDWYMTKDAAMKGFIARPVIGGVFIYTFHDPAFWQASPK
jgi:predicted methyltransferase